MAGLESVSWIVGSYIVIIVLIYIVINFLTRGFIHQYLKVKMSRGRLVFVKCFDVADNYYMAGKIDTRRNLLVKDKQKKVHTFSKINNIYINRELGVNIIEVNLVEGYLIKRDFSGATAFDLTMVDEMVNRAIMLPTLKGGEAWAKIEKLLFIIIIVGIGIVIYLLITQQPICNMTLPGGANI